ncbi:unnamed protein product [Amoebophrya sp. A25]|nr:unnamed protein product [Amoebophrya sp. A25]|eukprot:GSA25T00008846001.1
MQKHIRQATKYLLPSCSLQQAVALAEYTAVTVLGVNLTHVSPSGDNIFVNPGWAASRRREKEKAEKKNDAAAEERPTTDKKSHPEQAASSKEQSLFSAYEKGQALEETGFCRVTASELEREATSNTTGFWSEELFQRYHDGRSFEEAHGRTLEDWQKEKVHVPRWRDIILRRINTETTDFWHYTTMEDLGFRVDTWKDSEDYSQQNQKQHHSGSMPMVKFEVAGWQAQDRPKATVEVINGGARDEIVMSITEEQIVDLKQRLEAFLSIMLTEIDLLLHMNARWQRKGFFGTLLALPEARRLLKALAIIQRSILQEFYCGRMDLKGKASVAFQGEWKVEASVINLLSGGLGLDLLKQQRETRERIDTSSKQQGSSKTKTRKKQKNDRPETSVGDQEEEQIPNGEAEPSSSSTKVTSTTEKEDHKSISAARIRTAVQKQESSSVSPPTTSTHKRANWAVMANGQKRRVNVAKFSEKRLSSSSFFAKRVSKRFAFVSVMFDNNEVDVYINALRTLARSLFRVHRGKYGFVILSDERLSETTEKKLLREPRYNLEVRKVPASEIAENPRFGVEDEEEESSIPPAPRGEEGGEDGKAGTFSDGAAAASSSDHSGATVSDAAAATSSSDTSGGASNSQVAAEAAELPSGEEVQTAKPKKIDWWYERQTRPTAVGFYRWKLLEFEKVIFLDADMLLLRPIDELFQVTAPLAIGITPFATFRLFADMNRFPYLNIGVMVLTPNEVFFRTLMYALENPSSPVIRDTRLNRLFEKGLQQPWLDNFLVRNQVRLGYVRFEPLGTEPELARKRRKFFYYPELRRKELGDGATSGEVEQDHMSKKSNEHDSSRVVEDNNISKEQANENGVEQVEQDGENGLGNRVDETKNVSPPEAAEERGYSSDVTDPRMLALHAPPGGPWLKSTGRGDALRSSAGSSPDEGSPDEDLADDEEDDRSDSNQVPLTFVGCDENFATRWEHGELLGRGALLQPDTVILSLRSRDTLLERGKGYPTDANSIQRVYFTSEGRSSEVVERDLARMGYSNHLVLPYHCVLPMEYNFLVEYKTGTQLLDMVWNEHITKEQEWEAKDERRYERHLREEFGPETRFNVTRDLVAFTQMSLPPKVLHWAGENRKPWERIHPLSRSQFDQLWWDEFEGMQAELE